MITPILIAITGSCVLNLGFFLQKQEASQLPSFFPLRPIYFFQNLLSRKIWILGTFCTCIGWILNFFAIAIAPITIIAPFQNVGIIFLAFLAVIFLNESFHSLELIGLGFTLFGLLCISFESNTMIYTNNFYDGNCTFIYLSFIMIFVFIMVIGQKIWFPDKLGVLLGLVSGISAGIGSIFTKLLTIELGFSIEAGLFMGILILCQIISFFTLQTGFQRERAMILVPIFFGFSTLIPTIGGLISFYEKISLIQWVGILLIIIGTSSFFKFSNNKKFKNKIL